MIRKRQSPESAMMSPTASQNGEAASDHDHMSLASSPLLDDEESASLQPSASLISNPPPNDRRQPSFADGFQPATLAFRECFVYFVLYLGVGVCAYSFVFEEWSIIDSLYFSVTTFTTVGYGSPAPTNFPSQIFTGFFSIYGVCIIAIGLGILGQRILEQQQRAYESRRERAKRRLVHIFASGVEDNEDEESNSARDRASSNHNADADFTCLTTVKDSLNIVKKVIPLLLFVFIVACIIGHFEGWTVGKSIYYAVITTTTIGIGDVAPSSPSMRLLSLLFIPASVAVVGQILGQIAGSRLKREARMAEKKFLERELALSDLEEMDDDGDGQVSEADFISFMLLAMGKADKRSIVEIRKLFAKLDRDESGTLDRDDLVLIAEQKWTVQDQGNQDRHIV